MQITCEDAEHVIDGAEREARELDVPVVVAVFDAGAHLKALWRMDGAVLGSIDIAIRKAKTAALFECNSEQVWEFCKPGAPAPHLELTNDGLAPYGGGLVLKDASGTTIGSLGVSGGSIQQDMTIANAALAAFLKRR